MDDGSSHLQHYKLVTQFNKGHTIHTIDDPDAPPSVPPRLEHWKKCRTLGYGGQGRVILQECTSGGRSYTQRAVKMIRLEDDSAKQRYKRELEAIIRFSHDKFAKYFVKTLGWYASSNTLYIAMEYFPMGDLQTYIGKHGHLLEGDCRLITSQLLRGLAAMHEESFAHRDVKPQNILIHQCPPNSWWVKLADFGISKMLGADTSGSSRGIGTLEYMAPELLRSGQDSGSNIGYQAADMWALGVTAFFISTKTLPFQDPYSAIEYARSPDKPFPRGSLDNCQVSEDGKMFIHALIRPQPKERLESNAAMRHPWIHAWLPEIPTISDPHSGSSEASSRRSSFDDEKVIPTKVSNSTSRKYSNAWTDEVPNTMVSALEIHDEIRTLHEAAKDGSVEVINQLLKHGADVNSRNGRGRAPIHEAACYGHEAVVRLLVEKGADLEARSNSDNTPLLTAAYNGHEAVMRLLVEKGADLEARSNYDRTPLLIAAYNGYEAVVRLLIDRGANLEAKSNSGNTPLLTATYRGHKAVVRLLIDKGADLEAKDKSGYTPLSRAASNGHEAMVRLLVEKGADLEVKDKSGYTPLLKATWKGHRTVVRLLIDKGANLEAKEKSGNTPLLIAADKGHEAVVRLLIDKGANLEAKRNSGDTPLLRAAYKRNRIIARLLLEKGANTEVKDRRGNTLRSLLKTMGMKL